MKRLRTIALVVCVLLLAWAGYVVCGTTFSWSGPQQTGTLTYDGLGLTNPQITGALAVTNGGTGVGTLTDGGVMLGSGTDDVTVMAVLTDGQMIVGDGTTDPVAESGQTLRASIGVGSNDVPILAGINVGNPTDTTVSRASAGDLQIEANIIYRAGGTDVPVTDGGTGVGTLTDGGVLIGNGTGAFVAMAVLTDGQFIVGDGTTDPVAESGDTARASMGVGTNDVPNVAGLNVGNPADTTISRASAGDIAVEGNTVYRAGGTDVAVADGGTGLGSGTSGGVLAYTAAGTLASSAALAQYSPVIGGGAGVVPSTITAGTDNQALCGATGAAPAFRSLVDADIPVDITVTAPTKNATVSNLTANGTSTLGPIVSTSGNGTVTGLGSAVEGGVEVIHKSVFTFTATDIPLANGSHGTGTNLYTFPEGVIAIHGVILSSTVTNTANFNASTNDVYEIGIGSVVGADDATLTGTEQDIYSALEIDTTAGSVLSTATAGYLATPVLIDGHTTAAGCYLNFSANAGAVSGANVFGWSGTLTILWSLVGDF